MISPNRKHNRRFFYKYTTAKVAKLILINKTLRFSSPLLFNDPFDVARKLKFAFSGKEVNDAFLEELICLIQTEKPSSLRNPKLQALLQYSSSLTSNQRESFIKDLENEIFPVKLGESDSFKELQEKWDEVLRFSRILSVAAEKDNPVMWWSYAKNYRGVVIELECVDIYDSPLLVAKEVEYSNAPLTIGSLDYWVKMITGQIEFDYKEVFECLELTKTLHWAHEKEWRVIAFEKYSDQLYSDYHVHPRTFSKVFLGENTDEQDRNDIHQLIDFDMAHMKIYDMVLNHDSRKIEFRKARRAT